MKTRARWIMSLGFAHRAAALFGALLVVACAVPDDEDVVWDSSGAGPVASAGAGGSGGGGGGGSAGGGSAGGGGDMIDADANPKRYVYAASDVFLFRMDVETLGPGVVVEKVGEFKIDPDRMIDIAVTADERIYGVTWSSGGSPSKLWGINKDTAKATLIAQIPGGANVGLTFGADGTLLGADKSGRTFRVDPATGEVTEIGVWGSGLGASGDIVGTADGKLYGFADVGGSASEAINSLVMIDPMTGAAEEVGLTGFDNLWGAGVWCGTFYAFRSDGDLLEIDVQTGKATMLASKIPGTQSGFSGAATPIFPAGMAGGICP